MNPPIPQPRASTEGDAQREIDAHLAGYILGVNPEEDARLQRLLDFLTNGDDDDEC